MNPVLIPVMATRVISQRDAVVPLRCRYDVKIPRSTVISRACETLYGVGDSKVVDLSANVLLFLVIHIAYLISASWLNKILFMGVTPHGSVELVRSGVFANIHWGLIDIGGTGDILFLIGCVRAALVLMEAANESGTDTDGAGDGVHDILGERSGLVSADDEGIQLPSSHENREYERGGFPHSSVSWRK